MAVYQDKAKDRIKSGLRRMESIVARGLEDDYKEADTRKIVSDILTEYLGWDKFDNLTAEQMINSRYADYVIRKDGEELAVVEVKQIGLKLKDMHLNQARQYASDEGIEWIILTNGDAWKVYRQVTDKDDIKRAMPVFSLSISDKELKPTAKTELLYLLSEEASRKHELDEYYQRKVALSGDNLADHVLSDVVLNKLRVELKNSTGQKLSNSEVAEALVSELFAEEVTSEDISKRLQRIRHDERQKS